MNPNNPLARHSRAGGNPAKTNIPRSGPNEPLAASFEGLPNRDIAPLCGRFLIIWIPACAGMTQFFANGLFGLTGNDGGKSPPILS